MIRKSRLLTRNPRPKGFEKFQPTTDQLSFHLSVVSEEKIPAYTGECFWTMKDDSGEVTSGHIKNIVVYDAALLLARLMKGTGTAVPHASEPNFGVYALAVGTGDISWNPNSPPSGTNTQRSLYNELARKAVASTAFIDSHGAISGVPTNVVDFTTVFSQSEAVGPLMEMGLVGGDVSSNTSIINPILPPNGEYDPTVNTVGKDTLVNYVTFPTINKPATSSLSWTWRLTF